MKTNKLSFGFSTVAAGQKSSTLNAKPQLIANSTLGKFTITSAVSKVLGVVPGENVAFVNNLVNLNKAINDRSEDILAVAAELGVDIDTAEGKNAILDELAAWGICAGIKKFTKTGEKLMVPDRVTKEDKQKYLDAHRMEIVEANRDALVEKFGEMSDEELAENLTIDFVVIEVQDAEGSKTATTSTSTGIGLQLGFTDTNVWNQLKSDIDEDTRTKLNRYFDVDIENGIATTMNNGYEDVTVMVYPITFVEDKEPIVRERKAKDDSED